jgi:hypothetical protein
MGCDGDEHILVERELLLDVGEQRVDLVRVCVVYGRGDGHRDGERADRSEYVRTEMMPVGMNQLQRDPLWFPSECR